MSTSFRISPYVLSPLDHTIPKVYVSFFLSFPLENTGDGLRSLKTGILNLVDRLPILAGDIIVHKDLDGHENVQSVVRSNNETNAIPMLQVKRHLESSLEELASQKVRNAMENLHLAKAFAPLPDFINPQERRPILRFAASIMKDGILLAVTINHSFFDGGGVGIIMETLAGFCRTPNHYLNSPLSTLSGQITRGRMAFFSGSVDSNINHSQSYNATGTIPCLSSDEWSSMVELSATSLTSCRLKLPASKVGGLKDACNRILSDTPGADWPSYVSSNDVVSALIAICRSKCHSRQDKNECELTTIVNIRSRVDPPSPEYYLGNMITAVRSPVGSSSSDSKLQIQTTSQFGELGIGHDDLVQITTTAAYIRRRILTIDNRHVQSLFGYLSQQKDWNAINMQASALSISSWRDWKVYDFDFGPDLGAVSHFQMHFGLNDGLTVIMPAKAGLSVQTPSQDKEVKADWEMQLMIKTIDWPSLTSSPLFQWAFGGGLR